MTGLPDAQEVQKRKGGRRIGIGLAITAVVLVLVALALWAADSIFRGMAEDAAASTIEGRLPDAVSADVDISIEGGFFLPQLLSGSFTEITATTNDASYDGVPFDAVVHAYGVPTDTSGAIRKARADVTLDEDALNELLELPGSDPRLSLGEGTLSYEDQAQVFGFSVGYAVTAEPSAHGKTVELAPVRAEVTSDLGSLNLDSVIDNLLGGEPVSVCVASRLPEHVSVDDIAVSPGSAVITLHAVKLPLDSAALSTTGSCDEG